VQQETLWFGGFSLGPSKNHGTNFPKYRLQIFWLAPASRRLALADRWIWQRKSRKHWTDRHETKKGLSSQGKSASGGSVFFL